MERMDIRLRAASRYRTAWAYQKASAFRLSKGVPDLCNHVPGLAVKESLAPHTSNERQVGECPGLLEAGVGVISRIPVQGMDRIVGQSP